MSAKQQFPVAPPDHVKISKTGRPYVDIGQLIKGEMDRLEQSRRPDEAPEPPRPSTNGTNDTNGNNDTTGGHQ